MLARTRSGNDVLQRTPSGGIAQLQRTPSGSWYDMAGRRHTADEGNATAPELGQEEGPGAPMIKGWAKLKQAVTGKTLPYRAQVRRGLRDAQGPEGCAGA